MLSEAWEKIQTAFQTFISRESPQPPYIGMVAATEADSLAAGLPFVAEASYFSVRLVEMRLATGGKYFTTYLPLGVCVAEYTYGAERRRVPLVLNNETIKQMLGEAGGERQPGHAQFTNMPVVRRAPVKEDNLALFVGLFRMPYTDIARSMLQLAADVSEELGAATIGTGTRAAAKLYDRVAEVFKLNTVEPRFAFLNGTALTSSGYVLVSGPLPEDVKPAEFVVENSRLRLRNKPASMLDGFDYCLMAIEQHGSLLPSTDTQPADAALKALASMPFHQRWRGVATLLARRKAAEAEEELLTLRAEVVTSPDLTEEDRLLAIAGYDVAYQAYERPLLAKPGGAGLVTRGFRSGTPVTGLRSVAASRKASGDTATATALNAIALRMQVAPGGGAPSEENADKVFAEALAGTRAAMVAARAQGVRAAHLAEALSLASGAVA
jgi:hypothetical protein